MKLHSYLSVSLVTATLMLVAVGSYASGQVHVYTPDSSVENPSDVGKKVHTHLKALVLPGGVEAFSAKINVQTIKPYSGAAPISGYGYQTPASIACIYGLTKSMDACNPNNPGLQTNSGGSTANIIAIVDAYHYPNALTDLQSFSAQFNLPNPNLTVLYGSGVKPATSPNNWEVEEALDLQWAHAMAPNARLILVEAASNSVADLLAAVKVATNYIKAAQASNSAIGGVVSMSWGSSEFTSENIYDASFFNAGVVYFASSGDASGTSWPCVSQYVVCVGGTSLRLGGKTDASGYIGDFVQEVAWESGGGGYSSYVPKPSYQSTSVVGNFRGVPDISSVADPNSGGWIFYTPSNSRTSYWEVVGGTSWSSPTVAGITVNAGTLSSGSSSAVQLGLIYTGLSGFSNDIGNSSYAYVGGGWCGSYLDLAAVTGWDPCTGVGSH